MLVFAAFGLSSVFVFSETFLFGTTAVAATHKTNKAIASPQDAFSRKSAVFLTPIIWLCAWKFAAKPPPLLFCTNTTTAKSKQTTKIKIEIATNIFLNVLFNCFLLFSEFGLQNKHFFLD